MASNDENPPTVVYRTDWRTSEAKKKLQELIIAKQVTEASAPAFVYALEDCGFKEFKFSNFKTNLRHLLKSFRNNPTISSGSDAAGTLDQGGGEAQAPVYLKDWRSSQAKQVLLRLIESGDVTESHTPNEVYAMFDGFNKYKPENFATNLKNLLKTVADDVKAIDFDKKALEADRLLLGPEPEDMGFGYPRWYGTDHQKHLKQVVETEMHKHLDLEELLEMNQMWRKYPKDVFAAHILQEENRSRGRGYWLLKLKKKKHKQDGINKLLAELDLR
jgi:hypothetical protein